MYLPLFTSEQVGLVKSGRDLAFYDFALPKSTAGSAGSFKLSGKGRFLALYRPKLYWMLNAFGTRAAQVPEETQFLLYKFDQGPYLLLLPLLAGAIRATLCGQSNSISVEYAGALQNPQQARLLLAGVGDDPFKAAQKVFKAAQKEMKSFKLRTAKKMPNFMQYFGWCTWDAFYKEVTTGKVLSGLQSFQKSPVKPQFMILDDGWQQVSEEQKLQSFAAIEKKFPGGLQPLIKQAKQKYHLKYFGVWHGFQGYWQGVEPTGFPQYPIIHGSGYIRPWETEQKAYELTVIKPALMADFYDQYHTQLQNAGVDLLKVDNQSSYECAVRDQADWVISSQLCQQGLQKSVRRHFDGNLINCMSHSTDMLYNFADSAVMRNSDDYLPQADANTQRHHIAVNALNSFFISQIMIPDFDMFQTHSTGAPQHAAARAISGGPVYVCDSPGKQEFGFLPPFADAKGKILLPERPALPGRECLLADCEHSRNLLKLTNQCKNTALIAVFNVKQTPPQRSCKIAGTAQLSDLPDYKFAPTDQFVLTRFGQTNYEIISGQDAVALSLKSSEFAYLRFTPLTGRRAYLGDLSKYNAPAAIQKLQDTENTAMVKMRPGCSLSVYLPDGFKSVEASCPHEVDFHRQILTITPLGKRAYCLIIKY